MFIGTVKYLGFFITSIALIGTMVHCVYSCVFRPTRVFQWETGLSRKHRRTTALEYLTIVASPAAYALCLLAGMGIIFHSGTAFLLSWMSKTWIDGDGMWLGEFFPGLLTISGVLGILADLKASADRTFELEAARAVLEHSRTHFKSQFHRLVAVDLTGAPEVLLELEKDEPPPN